MTGMGSSGTDRWKMDPSKTVPDHAEIAADEDDRLTEVYVRGELGGIPAVANQQPETLRPLMLPCVPETPAAMTAGLALESGARRAKPAAALAVSCVISACALAFAFTAPNGGAQCAATGAPKPIAVRAAAVAPISNAPPAAIPVVPPAGIPEISFDALPVAAAPPARRATAKTRGVAMKVAATPIAPKPTPNVATAAPIARPHTDTDAAREASARARALLDDALR